MTDTTAPSLRTSAEWREKIKVLEAEQAKLKESLEALTDARTLALIENRAETSSEKRSREEAAGRVDALHDALRYAQKREYETRLAEEAAAETQALAELADKLKECAQVRVDAAKRFDAAAEMLNSALAEIVAAAKVSEDAHSAAGRPYSTSKWRDRPGITTLTGALMVSAPDLVAKLEINRAALEMRRPLAEYMALVHKSELGA